MTTVLISKLIEPKITKKRRINGRGKKSKKDPLKRVKIENEHLTIPTRLNSHGS